MFGKGAMSRHEKYCRDNPNNQHKCFEFCKHLKRDVHINSDDYENYEKRTYMTCMKTGKALYSYKFEKNTNKPVNALEGLERMPLECDLHEYMDSYDDDLII
jgi:hypothetical protein